MSEKTASIRAIESDNSIVITVNGNFTFPVYQTFFDVYSKYKGTRKQVEMDFSAVDYMDSAGIGMLLKMREEIGTGAGTIRLKGCNANLKKLMRITRLEDMFEVS